LLGETDAFIDLVQHQFESSGTWDMQTLETGLRDALLKDGCRILQGLLDQPHALGKYVPDGEFHENRSKTVQSLLGSFTLSRGYYQTSNGMYFPMDVVLGLTDSYTPGLAKLMCHSAGTDGSFGDAEKTLQLYAGVKVPATQIRKLTQQIGAEIGQWNTERQEHRCEAVPTMYMTYDGTQVPMRKIETEGRKGKNPGERSKGREAKLGCVFTSHEFDDDCNPVRTAESTSYIASFDEAGKFGSLMLQEARLRGLGRCERSAVLGDGAHWIWNIAQKSFPGAKQILDFFHACEHLDNLASVLFPEDTKKSSRHFKKWKKWLENDSVMNIVAEASTLKPRSGLRRKKVIKEVGYLESNAERMMYATFKKEGYFIGSGVVEAGCKTVVGKRAKQSGMHWRINGAQHVLNIRCSIMSETYDNYWIHRRNLQLKALNIAA